MFRGEKYAAPAAAALSLAVGASACGGANSCESPFKISREYPGDTRPDGVEIRTPLTKDAESIEIGFTDPGDNWHDEWIPSEGADRFAMSIGSGAVRFRVRIKASSGSAECKTAPNSIFIQKSYGQAVLKDGAVQPNPSGFRLDGHH